MSLSLGISQTSSLWALPSRFWRTALDARKRMKRTATLQRELNHMDARMLSDIGVSRAQLRFELDHDQDC